MSSCVIPEIDPEAVRDDPADREQERPVEVPQVRALARACARSCRDSLGCCVVDHQSVRARGHVGCLLVEELLEHLEGRGGRGLPAEAAVLDHGAHDEARRVVRAEPAPPGRVRRRPRSRSSRRASRPSRSCRRSGSGSGRRRRTRFRATSASRRRARADGRDRGRVEVQLLDGRLVAAEHERALRRAFRRAALLDRRDEMRRDELAAVREERVEARHLQRRGEHVLLADRELDRVTRLPEPVDLPVVGVGLLGERLPLPVDGRQETRGRGADVEPRLLGRSRTVFAHFWSGWPRSGGRS